MNKNLEGLKFFNLLTLSKADMIMKYYFFVYVLLTTLIFIDFYNISVPLTENNRRKRRDADGGGGDPDCRRASSRGLIPKAKVKTIKMTFVIVFGKFYCFLKFVSE